jgi:1-acyl-sn-glycerol-3-phosphate acyltransferase
LNETDFIEARESRLFKSVFGIYCRYLFRRRFRRIYLDSNYIPPTAGSTLYYMNHTSWWDALIPFLLNEYHYRQNARALMDIRQLRKFPFFKRLGVFSINRENPKSAVYSLKKASDWLEREKSSIYLFPQGRISNEFEPIVFENGIGWLAKNCGVTEIVPIAIHISHVRGDRPDLFLMTGKPLNINRKDSKEKITDHCRTVLSMMLDKLRSKAFDESEKFKDFFGRV